MQGVERDIPQYFCWTRFGTEAAQSVPQILARKEEERVAARGLFFWGIGNALGRSIAQLLRVCERPRVLFSSIKSRPRMQDVEPPLVVAWTTAIALDGSPYQMPDQALVVSRYDPLAPRTAHYALACHSLSPLDSPLSAKPIALDALRNLLTGRPVGTSQVTAVVERVAHTALDSLTYQVAMEAELVPPYFVELRNPIALARLDGPGAGRFDFAAARTEAHRRAAQNIHDQLRLPITPFGGLQR
jgi:hypothetical protein